MGSVEIQVIEILSVALLLVLCIFELAEDEEADTGTGAPEPIVRMTT